MRRQGRFGRAVRWVFAVLGSVVVLLVAGVAGLLWWSLPASDQRVRVAGLSAPVQVTLDGDGVPRIRAASARDGAAALGFLHARDRMFQMELGRRAASGRLSELAGPATLRVDRTMRVLGLRRQAAAELDRLQPDTRALLDSYVLGVNAWIAQRGRFAAPEFVALGTPEPWTPVDSLLWGKTMGLYLSSNWRTEMARATAPGPEVWPPQDETPRPDASLAPSRLAALVPQFPEPFTLPDTASNEWAVDGRHSATGAPLLAGDPHLAFSMPSLWYLARIETPGGVLAGATAPGVPFMVLGHNSRIAWTFTTTGADTQDVFVETVLPDGTYQTPDGPRAFDTREERIAVRGQPEDVLRVRATRHGPVLSDLEGAAGGPVLAVAMANLAPGDAAADGLAALNTAGDVEAAGAATALITAPVQNVLVADRTRIAQFTMGRVPLRRSGDGSRPVAGADGAYDWTGFASGSDLPQIIAPESGRLVNANERIAPHDFPVFMGRDWFGDWRAQRIRAVLAGSSRHDLDSFSALQVDAVSSFAQRILPTLLAVAPLDDPSRQGLALLAAWDGAMRVDQPQPLLFNAWMRQFETAARNGRGAGPPLAGMSSDVIAYLLSPGGVGCEGGCTALLSKTLADAITSLQSRYGADLSRWRWGAAHQAVFAHPLLGRLPWVGDLVTWRIEQPGDDTTVFRGGVRGSDWSSVHGAGFRGVYDLSDLDRSRFAVTPGQSGHPLRSTAASLMQRWRDGTTVLLGPEPARIQATVELSP